MQGEGTPLHTWQESSHTEQLEPTGKKPVGHVTKQSKSNQKEPGKHWRHIEGTSVTHISQRVELQGMQVWFEVDFVKVLGQLVRQEVKLRNDS